VKTLSELLALPVEQFDWFEALNLCVKQEPTHLEYYRLYGRANDWPTCACGQLCKALPRYSESKLPKDEILQEFGVSFTDAIEVGNWQLAISIMKQIGQRTAELLKGQAK
jgi:hypothetical protein